jgi:hypothetical protein
MNDDYFLKCKLLDGHVFKIICEILNQNLKDVCLEFSRDGISLQMMDSRKKILFNMILHKEDFQTFHYSFPENTKQIGFTIKYLYSMLKNIKKKDSIEIFVKKDDMYNLGIKVIPKDYLKVTYSHVAITNSQNITISEIPSGYVNYTRIPSQDFQKMCKELNIINNIVHVLASPTHVQFDGIMDNVFKKSIEFGDKNDDIIYKENFTLDYLLKISKISGLNKSMKIYTKKDLPLYLYIHIFEKSHLSIYLKPVCN